MTPVIPKDEDNQKSTFEIVSKSIIDEAASVYMINKYMSPAHKIEEISIRYNNAFLSNIMSQLRNLDALKEKGVCRADREKAWHGIYGCQETGSENSYAREIQW